MLKKLLVALMPLAVSLEATCYNTYEFDGCCSQLRPYITVGGGVVIPSKNGDSKVDSNTTVLAPTQVDISQFSFPNVLWKNHYQVGYEAFGAVGCALNSCIRVEGEFIYQGFERRVSGSYSFLEIKAATQQVFILTNGNPLAHASSHTNVYAALSNLYFDYQLCNRVNFFIGGGFGAAWIHSSSKLKPQLLHVKSFNPPIDETSPTIEKVPVITGSTYAWQLKVGGSYDVNRCFSVGLNYRLLGTGRFQSAATYIVSNPDTDAQRTFSIPQHDISGLVNNSFDLFIKLSF